MNGRWSVVLLTAALLMAQTAAARAQERWRIDFENGAAISGRNDVRIPGDSGTDVFDVDTQKVIAALPFIPRWEHTATALIWLNDREAACVDQGTWRRFDYRQGKILEPLEILGVNEFADSSVNIRILFNCSGFA